MHELSLDVPFDPFESYFVFQAVTVHLDEKTASGAGS